MTAVVGEDFESTDEHTAGTDHADSLLVQLVQAHSSAAVLVMNMCVCSCLLYYILFVVLHECEK